MTQSHFGEHITIDGYLGDPDKLDDHNLILFFLNQIVDLLHMHKLSEPRVFMAKGGHFKDPGGWSGYVIIEESHISIHTFPGTRFVSIDVYTCQNGLKKQLIIDYIKNIFSLGELEVNFIIRGKKYLNYMSSTKRS